MKKIRTMRAAALLLVLTLMTSCFVGGTFAKYVSTVTGSDTARVAKWAFTADSGSGDTDIDLTTAKTFEFDLFECVDANVDVDGAGDEHVIAPGTSGDISVELTNASEVNAEYTIDYTVDEAGVYIQWSTDGSTWVDEFPLTDVTTPTPINMGASTTITVYWKWAFNGDGIAAGQSDANDTTLGIAGSAAPSVTATVTVTQVD